MLYGKTCIIYNYLLPTLKQGGKIIEDLWSTIPWCKLCGDSDGATEGPNTSVEFVPSELEVTGVGASDMCSLSHNLKQFVYQKKHNSM